MAKLNVIIPTTGEEFEIPDLDFSTTTPKDILTSDGFVLPEAPQGQKWQLVKGSQVVDENLTLEELGFKDNDMAQIMAKVKGAFLK